MPTTKSLHEQIRDAVKDTLEADTFFSGSRVYAMDINDFNKVDLPCVICSFGVTEQVTGGTNERDDVKYPILVGLFSTGQQNSTSRVGLDPLRFRERVRMLFHMKRLSGITSALYCDFNGRPPIFVEQPEIDRIPTIVEINVHCRVSRAVS